MVDQIVSVKCLGSAFLKKKNWFCSCCLHVQPFLFLLGGAADYFKLDFNILAPQKSIVSGKTFKNTKIMHLHRD